MKPAGTGPVRLAGRGVTPPAAATVRPAVPVTATSGAQAIAPATKAAAAATVLGMPPLTGEDAFAIGTAAPAVGGRPVPGNGGFGSAVVISEGVAASSTILVEIGVRASLLELDRAIGDENVEAAIAAMNAIIAHCTDLGVPRILSNAVLAIADRNPDEYILVGNPPVIQQTVRREVGDYITGVAHASPLRNGDLERASVALEFLAMRLLETKPSLKAVNRFAMAVAKGISIPTSAAEAGVYVMASLISALDKAIRAQDIEGAITAMNAIVGDCTKDAVPKPLHDAVLAVARRNPNDYIVGSGVILRSERAISDFIMETAGAVPSRNGLRRRASVALEYLAMQALEYGVPLSFTKAVAMGVR